MSLRLAEWGAATYADIVGLLLSDVLNDAFARTASEELTVQVSWSGAVVRVAVTDLGPNVTEWDDRDDAERLRELLAERLPLRWGVDARQSGSTVWFEVEG